MVPMKHSRTPKRIAKSGQQNFKRMKRRLQLKVRVDEPGMHADLEDQVVLEEVPLASEQPQEEKDTCAGEDETGTVGRKAQCKNQSNLFNRASPMKIVRVCKGMVPAQRELIIKADFGDMLDMKCSKLIPELCLYLMQSFNPSCCYLDFGERGRIPVTTESVHRVMGVPVGNISVPYHKDVHATSLIMDMLGMQKGTQPSITSVEKELGPAYPADNVYLSKFIIYMVSSVFVPNTGTKISPKCYSSAINPKAVNRLNWAKFIIDTITQTANEKGKKNWFKACMPYLMILYVDSLETDALVVPKDGTRICIWTNKMIKLIVDLDTNSDGSFGKLPLKSCFRKKISLFSPDPSTVDMFIKIHVSGNHNEETFQHALAKYRAPVIDMCNIFEDGLAKFLVSLSTAPPTHEQEEAGQTKRKPNRRRRKTLADVQATWV